MDFVENTGEPELQITEAELQSCAQNASELEEEDKIALLEALVFASGDPLSPAKLCEITGFSAEEVEALAVKARERSIEAGLGFEFVSIAGGYQYRTAHRFSEYLRALKADRPRRLTGAALETLAIIAYRQPIVKSDIEKLRGVDATPTIKTLLDRGLVRIVGHTSTVGQPALYGTTDEFLKIFGMASLSELPTQRDLKELNDPGEVEEQGEVLVESSDEEPSPVVEESAPEA